MPENTKLYEAVIDPTNLEGPIWPMVTTTGSSITVDQNFPKTGLLSELKCRGASFGSGHTPEAAFVNSLLRSIAVSVEATPNPIQGHIETKEHLTEIVAILTEIYRTPIQPLLL